MPVRVRINGVWSASGSSSGTAPSVPLSVSATSTVAGQIDATWSPPSSAGSSPVSGYTMTATPSGGGTPTTKTVAAPAGGASITGLAQGASYAVTVVAQNGFAAGPASAPITVVVAASAGGNNWLLNPSAHGMPDATNTAPNGGQASFAGGTTTGNITLTAGQSLVNQHIIGKVTLSGTTGVAPVITNCFIDSTTNIAIDCSGWTGSNRPQITDSRIRLNNNTAACAVKPGNSDFVRCNISGGQDIVDTGVTGTFTACYVHGCQRFVGPPASHNDAFQSLSGSLTVTRCTVTTFFDYATYNANPDDFNSCFQLGEQSGAIGTILFDTCLLDGGHYAFNANWKSTTPNVDTAWPVGSGFRGPNAFTSTTIKSCRIGPTGQYRNLNWITNSVPPSGSVNRIGNVSDVTGAAI